MIDHPDPLLGSVTQAVRALHGDGLIGLPTETVYGLGANAESAAAVARIFAVKGRPTHHPLIVHLAPGADLEGWIDTDRSNFDILQRLIAVGWPGPLTVIVGRGPRVHDYVTGGRDTVGLRIPSHPIAQAILTAFGGGVAAPSANRFGHVSPTTVNHVLNDLGPRLQTGLDVVVDGGDATVGIESTIVDLTSKRPQILRPGSITESEVTAAIYYVPAAGEPAAPTLAAAHGPSRASGMLAAHYAPATPLVIVESAAAAQHLKQQGGAKKIRIIDRTADLVEAARLLYADFRAADADGIDELIMVEPPNVGLGVALRDRLRKAASGSGRPSRAG